jgi:hypothetical protein
MTRRTNKKIKKKSLKKKLRGDIPHRFHNTNINVLEKIK